MKVAIIMPLAEQRGGGEKRLWDLMWEGRNAGITWLLIFLEDGPLAEKICRLGIDTRIIKGGRLRQPHLLITTILKIAALLRQESADVVLSWMWKAHLYGCPASILSGVPSLWSQLEVPDDSLLKRVVTKLPASGVFINSKVGQEKLEKICPNRPIRLVYPGVALHQFDPAILPSPLEARKELSLPLKGPLIGIVGRLQRWKGMHTLIEAMPAILSKYPDAHCVIVGGKHDREPDYENYLNEQIRTLGLKQHVTLAGFQSNIPKWMQAMDIFVHASENEPFGIVIVEAMALGKPVIAVNEGGPVEIIIDGINGLLTPYGDSDALADAIIQYLREPSFCEAIKVAAQARAEAFSTRRYAEKFIASIYDMVPCSPNKA
ncbi:MAG: hypothetical protein Kow00121_23650 [Elainellaceae cyanobacterium]